VTPRGSRGARSLRGSLHRAFAVLIVLLVVVGASGIGSLLLQQRSDHQHARATVLLVSTLGLLALAVVTALGTARRTVRRITGPFDGLQRTLNELQRGDLTARVSPTGPRELVSLGHAVNNLADEVDRRTGAFVSTVSHELRTPLTSILGYLELMEDGTAGPVPEELQESLSAVHRNSARLLELVEDLLTVSRLDDAGLLLASEPVDLRHVVSAASASASNGRRAVAVAWSGPERPVTVLGDAGQLRRVVVQLLSNAVTFTPDGGRVDVLVGVEGGDAVIRVVDNGVGIAHAEQEHVFHRFYRPAATDELAVPGSGLGLAIVRGVVQQHGGSIRLDSEPGVGTTVTVRLPLVAGSRDPVRPLTHHPVVPEAALQGRPE
jgi:signal transduction histidine kinase